jgi:hypothetical protein
VSQTEGKELPEFSERMSGSAGEYRERLVDFVNAQGIALEFKESIAPALGMSYGGKIALLPGQSSAEEFSTLVHELAHLCCFRNYVECLAFSCQVSHILRLQHNIIGTSIRRNARPILQ